MTNEGYIKLYRKIKSSTLWRAERKFSKLEGWIDLLLLAQHKETKVMIDSRTVQLKRGQLLTSQLGLSERWRWSIGKLNKFLKYLKDENRIEFKGENKFTIISILNWDKYQVSDEESESKKEVNNESEMKTERKQNDYIQECNKNETRNTSSNELVREQSQNKFFKIISIFSYKKKVNLRDPAIKQSFVKRNIRSAKLLAPYELARIEEVMSYLEENSAPRGDKKWGLETVLKFIDEDLDKLGKESQHQNEWKCDWGHWHKKNEQCGHNNLFN